MQLYLAGLEGNCKFILSKIENNFIEYGLVSYFYLKNNEEQINLILSKCKHLLIDSGAHSFQHGKKVNFEEYTKKYVQFIKKWTNNPKIIGFFEMDIDNVLGYEKVLALRAKLTTVSDKIIPVWHNNRGIDEYIDMCKEYSGKRISITGFANNDIKDSQYNLFINTAHKYKCHIHILGLTRFRLIKELNLNKEDSFDSSSWKQTAIFGGINIINKDNDIIKIDVLEKLKISWEKFAIINFNVWNKAQELYKEVDNSIYFNK